MCECLKLYLNYWVCEYNDCCGGVDGSGGSTHSSTTEQQKVTLVFFLGGVTYAEVSALRFLSQLEDGELHNTSNQMIATPPRPSNQMIAMPHASFNQTIATPPRPFNQKIATPPRPSNQTIAMPKRIRQLVLFRIKVISTIHAVVKRWAWGSGNTGRLDLFSTWDT